jgi:hypothetical protein
MESGIFIQAMDLQVNENFSVISQVSALIGPYY